jgi:CRISPR/Cas system CSM-associated protein Csm3 (group 7 of RAMP superfamily)
MIAIGPPGTSPKLRTLEYIKPGTNFDFSIKLRRFDERIAWGAGLLLTITKEINEGIIQIGGQKTRGYGWCRIEVEEPKKAEQERLMKKWEEYATHSSTTSS